MRTLIAILLLTIIPTISFTWDQYNEPHKINRGRQGGLGPSINPASGLIYGSGIGDILGPGYYDKNKEPSLFKKNPSLFK